MRIGAGRCFHLTYCTNIHPGESWAEVFANLRQYAPLLKARLRPDEPFGLGLRLSDLAARELLQGEALAQFKSWLAGQGLYVFTLNGFPYGGFHRQLVKDQVYAPDWRSSARVDYTRRLSRILAALLPADMEGSISTVPLSYKPWLDAQQARTAVLEAASINLARVTATLIDLARATGQHLHVDLEPEPDCLLENSADTIDFFRRDLWPTGGAWLARERGLSRADAEAALRTHIGVCYDSCHFALQYEPPAEALARLADAGLRIGKVQLSAALKLSWSEPADRHRAAERLRPFIDGVYLHQIVERRADGGLHHYPDLLATSRPHPQAREWRVHFHVPIFVDDYVSLSSTQDELRATLTALRQGRYCPCLEIETYTWDVLPGLKLDLIASIEREYRWVLDCFADAGPVHGKKIDGSSSLFV
jgi:sugar phosphate isomerase/epimerase